MSICVLTMARNEAGRYLPSALAAWQEFASAIVAIDDDSDDETFNLLYNTPKTQVIAKIGSPIWGNEWHSRATLWDAALESQCEWLMWLDADMVPGRDPRELMHRDVDAIAFTLYDLWNWREPQLMYRLDGQWQAHHNPRIWMIRRPRQQPDGGWQWNERGIHCGHLPANYQPNRTLVAPIEYSLLHYGYARDLDRWAKQQQYLCQGAQLSAQEYLHASSITDAAICGRLPISPQWRLSHSLDESSLEPVSASRNRSSTPTIGACVP